MSNTTVFNFRAGINLLGIVYIVSQLLIIREQQLSVV